MKDQERRFLRATMYVTAAFLWLEGLFVIIAPLGYLRIFGVPPFADAVFAGVRTMGVPLLLLGLLAWDASRKPPKHIGIASLMAFYFLASAVVRAASMTLEGEIGTIYNPIMMSVEIVFGAAHAGWYYLWSDRPGRK